MDRQLLERMVGAGVLVLALVIVTPALLDGNRTESRVSRSASLPENGNEMRTHTIRPDTPAKRPPVARDVVMSAGNSPASGNSAKPQQPSPTAEAPVENVSGSRTEPPPVSVPDQVVMKPAPERESQPLQKSAVRISEPSPATSAANAGNTGVGWVVQLGSFANKKNAQGLVDSVSGKGFSSYLLPLARSGQKTLYRVRVGPPADRSRAEQLASALKKAGYPGQVVGQ